ncbi:hypothetical protein D3C73_1325600 [compost metagenome]
MRKCSVTPHHFTDTVGDHFQFKRMPAELLSARFGNRKQAIVAIVQTRIRDQSMNFLLIKR